MNYKWLSLLLFAGVISLANANEVKIGVYAQTDNQGWSGLQSIVNKYLRDENTGITVRLIPNSQNTNLKDLYTGKIEGAIISPLRYVILDANKTDLEVVLKLQRNGGIEYYPETEKLNYKASDSYKSILLIKRNSGDWEPVANSTKKFRYLSNHSTSGFIYPHALMKAKGLLENHAVELNPQYADASPTNIWDPNDWFSRDSNPEIKRVDPEDLIRELASDSPTFDILAVNDHQLSKVFSKDSQMRLALKVVETSEPIPYDPLVFSRNSIASLVEKGGDSTVNVNSILESLKGAFQSFNRLSAKEKDELFNLKKKGALHLRTPDIHAFVNANNQTYDSVRVQSFLNSDFPVLKLGVLLTDNAELNIELKKMFRNFNELVFRNSTSRLFFDIKYFPHDQVDGFSDDVEKSKFDLVYASSLPSMDLISLGAYPVAQIKLRGEVDLSNGYQFYSNKFTDAKYATLIALERQTGIAFEYGNYMLRSNENFDFDEIKIIRKSSIFGLANEILKAENDNSDGSLFAVIPDSELKNLEDTLNIKQYKELMDKVKAVPSNYGFLNIVKGKTYCGKQIISCSENNEKYWTFFTSSLSVGNLSNKKVNDLKVFHDTVEDEGNKLPSVLYIGKTIDHDLDLAKKVFNFHSKNYKLPIITVAVLVSLSVFGVVWFAAHKQKNQVAYIHTHIDRFMRFYSLLLYEDEVFDHLNMLNVSVDRKAIIQDIESKMIRLLLLDWRLRQQKFSEQNRSAMKDELIEIVSTISEKALVIEQAINPLISQPLSTDNSLNISSEKTKVDLTKLKDLLDVVKSIIGIAKSVSSL